MNAWISSWNDGGRKENPTKIGCSVSIFCFEKAMVFVVQDPERLVARLFARKSHHSSRGEGANRSDG